MDYSRDGYGLQPRIVRGTAPIDGDAMPKPIVSSCHTNVSHPTENQSGNQYTTSLPLLHSTLQIAGYGRLDRLDSTAAARRNGSDALETRP